VSAPADLLSRARCAWITYVDAILDGCGSESAMESLLDVRALYDRMTADEKQEHLAFRSGVAKAMLDRLYEFCDGGGGKKCCDPPRGGRWSSSTQGPPIR